MPNSQGEFENEDGPAVCVTWLKSRVCFEAHSLWAHILLEEMIAIDRDINLEDDGGGGGGGGESL